ncbi:hypothetical protein LshimejAT787_0100750 [Lyophyllum shimeji]|uniref:Uncharacterized protein n=1 Tax=Lyophyllum shimeji TaxID=47721 RepID=A0A9P3UJD0_LYOSH|nr:hypothetical protein LshimejAT787_0100750 [Lyophyllum shimeji]
MDNFRSWISSSVNSATVVCWDITTSMNLVAATAPARAALDHCPCVDTISGWASIRPALPLDLVKVRLLGDRGTAVLRDLVISGARAIKINRAYLAPSCFDDEVLSDDGSNAISQFPSRTSTWSMATYLHQL